MAPTPRDTRANLARLAIAARQARRHGATILVTPELALTGYDIGALDAAALDPALLLQVLAVAERAGIALVVGLALPELDDDRVWNAAAVVDRTGTLQGIYRKAHLFGEMDRSRFAPGPTGTTLVDVDGVLVAALICYDVEFPEPARLAALRGAHLLAIPTANMHPWSVVNEHVIPARAFENHLYVAYANHCGREGETTYLGRSVIAAPDGTTRRAGADEEEIVVLPFDTDEVERRRREATHLTDRRPELYHPLTLDYE